MNLKTLALTETLPGETPSGKPICRAAGSFRTPSFGHRFGMLVLAVGLTSSLLLVGCKPPAKQQPEPEKETSKSGIFGKTTQEIGEYDPDAGLEVSDGKMKEPSPLNPLGALNAYKPAIEKISRMKILQAVNLFQAEFGRYPRDYDEFMEKIIKRNGIKLPVLPGDWQYQYDVANHELLIVKAKPDDE